MKDGWMHLRDLTFETNGLISKGLRNSSSSKLLSTSVEKNFFCSILIPRSLVLLLLSV